MNMLKLSLAAVVLGAVAAASAQAQVVVYRPGFSVPLAPRVLAAPVAYPAPVVTAYRPVISPYVAPAPVVRYSSYRAVYPVAPVYRTSAVVATTRYRPVVVGRGVGRLPNLYVPGQPVRNALRFAVP